MKKTNFEWPPLESDPAIFNKYFRMLGLPTQVSFEEILSFDYKEVQIIEGIPFGIAISIGFYLIIFIQKSPSI